jgi:nitroreductase
MDALEALLTRRSPGKLIDPAPDDAALKTMLDAAMRAPDHGRLRPWRFIVLRGDARARLGDLMAEAMRRREPEIPSPALEKERAKPLRAPLIVVIAAALVEGHKIPAVEQLLAAGAAAQNLQIAAHALGFGAVWRTGAPAYDAYVKQSLGLGAADAIVGFMYLGTPAVESAEGKREAKVLDRSQLVRDWPAA